MATEAILILAAGLGTRLRPATLKCPKPLIPVAGIDPLFFSVFKAHSIGIRDFFVNVHHLPDLVRASVDEFRGLFPDSTFEMLDESGEVLGSGGALLNLFARHGARLQDRALWVSNADTLAEFDWAALRAVDRPAFAVSLRADHLAKYNPLWVAPDGEFRGVGKHIETRSLRATHFVGVQRFPARDVNALLAARLETRNVGLFESIYATLAAAGRAPISRAVYSEGDTDDEHGFFFDMTNEAFLVEAQTHLLNVIGRSSLWRSALRCRYPQIREHSAGVWVSGEFPASVVLHAPCVAVAPSTGVTASAKVEIGPESCLVVKRGLDLGEWADAHLAAGQCRGLSVLLQEHPVSPREVPDVKRRVWVD